eukprot:TRINITY_DN9661_c3_g1_i1.p1 TRINITY_DN9661_c3_g1~~TRINITY_DN9661_c3_g1_i1.p1  ORF type:complete len:982 (+),score=193.64 TRINITY_DN9661_c3_g1_i1:94-3039(+)
MAAAALYAAPMPRHGGGGGGGGGSRPSSGRPSSGRRQRHHYAAADAMETVAPALLYSTSGGSSSSTSRPTSGRRQQHHQVIEAQSTVGTALALQQLPPTTSRWRGRISVSCRVRPLLASEANQGRRCAPWVLTDRSIALGRSSSSGSGRPSTAPAGGRELGERSTANTVLDAVFGARATTREVYQKSFREIVAGAAEGLNGAILAYGQTSSGKTFSISGGSASSRGPPAKGIIHYALEDLFSQLQARYPGNSANGWVDSTGSPLPSCHVRMSYCEVYMERVNDLLREGPQSQHLPVKEDAESRSFYVEGLKERHVSCAEEVIGLLAQAEKRRRVACTRYNEVSSRSHSVLTLVVECCIPVHGAEDQDAGMNAGYAPGEDDFVTRVGRLAFVDLAGNERVEAGAEYMAESNSINKSLFFLGKVIERLAAGSQRHNRDGPEAGDRGEYLPVRDSNLTRLLAVHLGGNSRTGLLVTLTPSLDSVEESLSTLRFAQKATTIRSVAQPVYVSREQSIIIRQQETIAQLNQQVQELKDWQRQQQQQLPTPSLPSTTASVSVSTPVGSAAEVDFHSAGSASRVVQQLREENARLRSSMRYVVEERDRLQAQRGSESSQSDSQEVPQEEEPRKRSDGTEKVLEPAGSPPPSAEERRRQLALNPERLMSLTFSDASPVNSAAATEQEAHAGESAAAAPAAAAMVQPEATGGTPDTTGPATADQAESRPEVSGQTGAADSAAALPASDLRATSGRVPQAQANAAAESAAELPGQGTSGVSFAGGWRRSYSEAALASQGAAPAAWPASRASPNANTSGAAAAWQTDALPGTRAGAANSPFAAGRDAAAGGEEALLGDCEPIVVRSRSSSHISDVGSSSSSTVRPSSQSGCNGIGDPLRLTLLADLCLERLSCADYVPQQHLSAFVATTSPLMSRPCSATSGARGLTCSASQPLLATSRPKRPTSAPGSRGRKQHYSSSRSGAARAHGAPRRF